MMTKEIMDLKEIAGYLGFSETKIYRLIKADAIPYAKIGGQYRFVKSEIDEWLKGKGKISKGDLWDRIKNEKDKLTRCLLTIGLLTKEMEKSGVKPVVVGGQAVEFYTAGGYATMDIDIVTSGYDLAGNILKSWGFTKEGRHWSSEELDLSIEIPASVLAGDDSKITEVDIEGLTVYMIGVEDLIIDRINAYVHWGSKDDGTWAKELMLLNKDQIDWKYLQKRATTEKTEKALKDLCEDLLKKGGNPV